MFQVKLDQLNMATGRLNESIRELQATRQARDGAEMSSESFFGF